MPRARAFQTQAMARVWDELRYAPPQTLARMAQDAEAFAAEVAPLQAYPEDLVVARITRYRPEGVRVGDVVVGAALIGDLSSFVEHVSARAPLERSAYGQSMSLAQAAASIGVSRATLQRYRRRGLMCHHVRAESGRSELRILRASLDAFVARHPALVRRAAGTGRLRSEERAAITGRAIERLQAHPRTVRALAQELAGETGRSARTIRRALQDDARIRSAVTRTAERTLDDRSALQAARAWQQGVSPQHMAEHGLASVAACTRAVARGRALALREAVAHAHPLVLPTFARADSAITLLAPRAVCNGLPSGEWSLPTPKLAPGKGAAARPLDIARVIAHHYLLWRAARATAGRKRPDTARLDAAERDLRWAYRLRRAMIEAALPDALARVAQHLGVPWSRVPSELQWKWAAAVCGTMGHALDFRSLSSVSVGDVHPLRAAAMAVERMLTRADLAAHVGCMPAHMGASVVAPWMTHLEPGDRWVAWLPRVAAADARLVARRFGLDGKPPATTQELAPLVPGSAAAAQGRLYAAMASLRKAARGD